MNSDFKDLLSLCNREKVEYLLVGGYAVSIHSEPRYTKDIDIWVNNSIENSKRVYTALAKFGAPLKQLKIEVIDFQKEGYFVQFGKEPSRIDILMSIKGLKFKEAWERRDIIKIDDINVNLISREDLITAKLNAGRPLDLIDVQALKDSTKSS